MMGAGEAYLVCWSLSWTVTSPPGWLPRRETQGAAAEVASDGRNGRTRSTTRTGCEEGAADRAGVAAAAIGERITAGVARAARRLEPELGVRSRGVAWAWCDDADETSGGDWGGRRTVGAGDREGGSNFERGRRRCEVEFYITDSAGAAAAQPGHVGGKTAARPILIPRFPTHAEPRAARPDHGAGSVRV